MAHSFDQTINYSSCNEDWRTERHALQICANDHVLCVTGSGDRPLHLMLDHPANIVAIDRNPCQTHLLTLKLQAMHNLTTDAYCAFLGLSPDQDRHKQWLILRNGLPEATRSFWEQPRFASQLQKGILYQGRFERYYHKISWLARLFHPILIRRLFSHTNLIEQQHFVEKHFNTRYWHFAFNVLCSKLTSRVFLQDPCFYANVTPGMHVGSYILDNLLAILKSTLARENFMLALIFQGKLSPYDLPPYLTDAGIQGILNSPTKLQPVSADLITYLEKDPTPRFEKFSFSDVPSYLDQNSFERLLYAMIQAAKPGARFCIRQFLSGHTIPARFAQHLKRDHALEEQLAKMDRAFVFRFIVGEIHKD